MYFIPNSHLNKFHIPYPVGVVYIGCMYIIIMWKQIEEFPNYEAHPDGKVRRIKTKTQIQGYLKNGYTRLELWKDKNRKARYLHRLVAITFIPKTRNPVIYAQIDHIDGNKQNNNIDNLDWVSQKENKKRSSDQKILQSITDEKQRASMIEKIRSIRIE